MEILNGYIFKGGRYEEKGTDEKILPSWSVKVA